MPVNVILVNSTNVLVRIPHWLSKHIIRRTVFSLGNLCFFFFIFTQTPLVMYHVLELFANSEISNNQQAHFWLCWFSVFFCVSKIDDDKNRCCSTISLSPNKKKMMKKFASFSLFSSVCAIECLQKKHKKHLGIIFQSVLFQIGKHGRKPKDIF